MADKPHLRLADHTYLANDDPFAELTKIMGFDPRQAARPTAASEPVAPAAAPIDDGFDEMDFSIDLEKELMGDFAEPPAIAAPRSSFEPLPQAVEAEATIPYEPVAAEAVTVSSPVLGTEDEIAFDADWFGDDTTDAGMAAEALSPEPRVQPYEFALDRDLEDVAASDLSPQSALSAILQPANDVPPVEAVDPLADLDFYADDLTDTAVPDEFVVDNHDIGDHTADVYAAERPAEEAFAADEMSIDDVFASALDDVDLRFDAAEPADTQGDEFDDLDRELDLSLRGGLVGEAEHDDHAAVAVATESQGSEMSLEDELNALLGNALSRQSGLPVAAAAAPTVTPPAQYVLPRAAEEHVSEAAYRPLSIAPVGEREDRAAEMAAVEWPEADDDLVPVETDFAADEIHAAEPAAAEEEFDLDFDDQAFDAAISRSIHGGDSDADYVDDTARADATVEAERDGQQDASSPYAALAALSATLKPARVWPLETPVVQQREAAPGPVRHEDDRDLSFEPDADFEADLASAARPAFEPDVDFARQPADAPQSIFAAAPAAESLDPLSSAPAYRDRHVPDIDTLDVPEQAVALADDLDLPDFAYEDDAAPAPSYDDIDAEFTSLLNEMNAAEDEPPAPVRAGRHDDYHDDYRAPSAPRNETPTFAGVPYAAPLHDVAAAAVSPAPRQAMAPDMGNPARAVSANAGDPLVDQDFGDMEFAYDPDLDEEMALPPYTPTPQSPPRRRGMMVAAVIGGVAILGGIGALALSFGDGIGTNEPVLVQADDTPVKIKPENPGGTTIPNQDSKVYDSVAGGTATADATQDKLVSTEEEPVEMPAPLSMDEAEALEDAGAEATAPADPAAIPPSQKAEDRIEQAADDAGVDNSVEVAAVAPRKVRTMIVKADGTLVAREEPASAPVAETAAAGMTDPVPSAGPVTGTVAAPAEAPVDIASAPAAENTLPIATAPAEPVPAPALAPVTDAAPKPTEAAAPAAPTGQEQSSTTPNRVPIAPARPSDQPVDIVGEVKPERVAAVSTAAAAPGAWAMQIASQPTEAAAKSSYQDLLRRYGAVLEGRQANIVKADISGKGTFWRVRVAAGSRNEAVSLCESYKSAGGNCFVSK